MVEAHSIGRELRKNAWNIEREQWQRVARDAQSERVCRKKKNRLAYCSAVFLLGCRWSAMQTADTDTHTNHTQRLTTVIILHITRFIACNTYENWNDGPVLLVPTAQTSARWISQSFFACLLALLLRRCLYVCRASINRRALASSAFAASSACAHTYMISPFARLVFAPTPPKRNCLGECSSGKTLFCMQCERGARGHNDDNSAK